MAHTKFTLIKTVSQLDRFSIYRHINESTVRGFKKRYKAQIKDEISKRKTPKTVIVNKL